MREKYRQRVDWDEEARKTERIRRKGLFISALSFAVAAAFIFGAGGLKESGVEFSRKVIFTLCLLIVLFLARVVLRRRGRLRRERQELEEELALRRLVQMHKNDDK